MLPFLKVFFLFASSLLWNHQVVLSVLQKRDVHLSILLLCRNMEKSCTALLLGKRKRFHPSIAIKNGETSYFMGSSILRNSFENSLLLLIQRKAKNSQFFKIALYIFKKLIDFFEKKPANIFHSQCEDLMNLFICQMEAFCNSSEWICAT